MFITAVRDTLLKKAIKASASDKFVPQNSQYRLDQILDRSDGHALIKLSYGQGDWYVFQEHWSGWATDDLWSLDQFKRCFPTANIQTLNQYHPLLLDACSKAEINTPLRISAFFAQIGHESESFIYSEEIASGAAYEGRRDLGNTQRGDGVRYKGRGIIQITGRANYKKYGDILGLALEQNPQLAKDPAIACKIAAAFWKEKDLNRFADKSDFKRINGGLNGYSDRFCRYSLAKSVLIQ